MHREIEKSIALIRREIEISEMIDKLIPTIKETLSKFDGKPFSKRFDTALKKALDSSDFTPVMTHEYNSVILKLYPKETSLRHVPGVGSLSDTNFIILHQTYHSSSGGGLFQLENAYIHDNLCIQSWIGGDKEIVKLKLFGIEQMQAEKKRIEDEIEAFNDSIPFTIEKYIPLRIKRG